MIDHDVMIAAKVSMLEVVMRDVLIWHFAAQENSVESAKDYARRRGRRDPNIPLESDLEPIRDAVWQQFLDGVVAGVSKQAG